MSSYRGDLSPSDRADIESFKPVTCKYCRGSGVVFSRSGPPVPCGCDQQPEEDDPCLTSDEKADQAKACSCRGTDDMCPCQNVRRKSRD